MDSENGDDKADIAGVEDQDTDTFNEAMDALGDDEEEGPTEEQTDLAGEEASEDGEPSGDTPEADANDDLEEGEEGDDAVVALSDGEEVSLGELKKGYFRNKDYTHKTESLAQERKAVEELQNSYQQNAEALQTAYQNLSNFVENLIPQEPDIALAQSDPGEYNTQKALRDAAIAALQGVNAAGDEVNASIQGASEQELVRLRASEEAKLIEAMPILKDPGQMAAFHDANQKTAHEFGFSKEEIATTTDSRVLRVVHYARLGLLAEQNRKNAARRVAEKPNKGPRPNLVAGKSSKNREAMKRLNNSGSIDDAMMVSFD